MLVTNISTNTPGPYALFRTEGLGVFGLQAGCLGFMA